MRRFVLLLLAVPALACGQYITPTPTAQPIQPTVAVIQPSPTSPAAQIPPTPSPTATAQDVAVVVVPAVNYRETPGGAVIGSLTAGDSVTVRKCLTEPADVAGWCEVEVETEQMFVYIWAGCLSVESGLKCEAE